MKKKPDLKKIIESEREAAIYQHSISQNSHNSTKGVYFTGKLKALTTIEKHLDETEQIGIYCIGCQEFT